MSSCASLRSEHMSSCASLRSEHMSSCASLRSEHMSSHTLTLGPLPHEARGEAWLDPHPNPRPTNPQAWSRGRPLSCSLTLTHGQGWLLPVMILSHIWKKFIIVNLYTPSTPEVAEVIDLTFVYHVCLVWAPLRSPDLREIQNFKQDLVERKWCF